MIQMTVGNGGATEQTAHFWIATEPGEELKAENRRLRASTGALRAVVDAPSPLAVEPLPGSEGKVMAGRLSFAVPPGASRSWVVKLPFVSDLTPAESLDLERLDYDTQRRTVVSYWRELVQETVRFAVPEEKFNLLARSVVPHIHITAAKDPGSGLYMVGAASYNYQVFANETAFQATLLDILGDHKTAQEYFETLLALQGSRNYPGMHKGPYDAIFHGARVDEQYDYTASNYGLDHGTILWSLAEHYLYSRDRTWLQRAWPRMRKAIEWILAQRATTRLTRADGGKVPEYGLLPASHLEDNADWAHWFTINAFCWAGIRSSAEAMKDIGHADAAMLEREAAAYLEDLRLAIRRAWQAAPVTRMRDGTYSPYVPVEPYQRWRRFGPKRAGYYSRYGRTSEFSPTFRLSATREVLYGPVMYLNLGVFKPDEPAANWILDDWEDNLTLSSGAALESACTASSTMLFGLARGHGLPGQLAKSDSGVLEAPRDSCRHPQPVQQLRLLFLSGGEYIHRGVPHVAPRQRAFL